MGRLGELEPVPRRSTVEIVSDELRSAIMYGALEPGAQLGEAELAARLGISRGPLREAMQRLVQEGLLVSEPHRGLFVITLDEGDVEDVYLTRLAIERAACQLIMQRNRGEAVRSAERGAAPGSSVLLRAISRSSAPAGPCRPRRSGWPGPGRP